MGREKRIRFTSTKKFLVTSAVSLALHAGIIGPPTISILNRTFKKQPALIEENSKEIKPNTQEQIEMLKTEKRKYIQELLEKLNNGQHIPVSEFFIRTEVMDNNIAILQSNSNKLVSEDEAKDKYQKILDEARKQTDKRSSEGDKLDALHQFAHDKLFKGYYSGSRGFLDIMKRGAYNCFSSSVFLAALEDDIIGSDKYGIIVLDPPKDPELGNAGHMLSWHKEKPLKKDGHIMSWHKRQGKLFEIENTDGGIPVRTKYKKGLRISKNTLVAAYLLENGIELEELPEDIRKQYKKGIGDDFLPVAGVSTDLPDPPDYFIPNPYFKVKKKPNIGNTRKLYEKMKEIAAIINYARAVYIIEKFLYFRSADEQDNGFTVYPIPIPEDIDWCDIAFREEDNLRFEAANAIGPARIAVDIPKCYGAVEIATLLADKGDEKSALCTRKVFYEKYKQELQDVVDGKKSDDPSFFEAGAQCAIFGGEKAREFMLPLYVKGNSSDLNYDILLGLSYLGYEEDTELFANELNTHPEWYFRLVSALALAKISTPEAEQALFSALKTEKTFEARMAVIYALGRLGYAAPALDFLAERHNEVEDEDLLRKKQYQSENIRPWKLSVDEVERIDSMILKEKDLITKAHLVAALAKTYKKEKAILYAKELLVPEMIKADNEEYELSRPILSFGEIKSPEIQDMLLSVLEHHPNAAPEIGRVLVEQHYQPKEVIDELMKLLADPEAERARREYAAYVLVKMGVIESPKPIK